MAKTPKVVIVEPGDEEENTKRPDAEEDDDDEDEDEEDDPSNAPDGDKDEDDEEDGDESDYDQIANRNRRTAKAMSDTTKTTAAGKEAAELTYMEADEFVKSLTEGLSEIVSEVLGKKAIRRIVAEEIAKAIQPVQSRIETIEKAAANISEQVEEMTGAQDELMKAISDKTDAIAKSASEKKAAEAKGTPATKTDASVTTAKADVLEKGNVTDPEEAKTVDGSLLVKAHALYDEAMELRNRYGEPIEGMNSDYTLSLNKGKADAAHVARLEKGLSVFKQRHGLAA